MVNNPVLFGRDRYPEEKVAKVEYTFDISGNMRLFKVEPESRKFAHNVEGIIYDGKLTIA